MLSGIVGNTTDVLVLIVLFGASIFIHEFGHFIAAVKLGLVVDTFSIGFGPAIWKKKIKGILFKISWFPLGGYVALPQLDPSGMSRIQGVTEDGKEIERELPSVSGWRKIIVSVAGAAGNVLFAVILALVIYFSPGAVTYKGTPVVASVTEESAAYTQGLRAGDEIMAVNDQKVSSWYEVNIECLFAGASNDVELTVRNSDGERILTIPLVAVEGSPLPIIEGIERKTIECLVGYVLPESSADAAGIQANDIIITFNKMEVPGPDEFIEMVSDCDEREYPIVVERDGEVLNLKVVPIYNEELERSLIGISIVKMVMPWMREKEPVAQLRADAMGIVHLLKALVTPKKSKQAAKGLGGPVAIVAALWIAIKISLFNAVGFLRFLNINLAILNLLPIPVLDGGHIMFALWEMITRRRANPKVVNILVNAFAILLISAF
ncbi:RIP metalloprotease RseP, partial [PVC group bacterium]|nr:RIP metalloprotease RseP [PVC group bacterium]